MRTIAVSTNMKGGVLDDDYTLYDNGDVLHEFDKHTYPGGFNLKETLKGEDLRYEIKLRLLNAGNEDDKELIKQLLKIDA